MIQVVLRDGSGLLQSLLTGPSAFHLKRSTDLLSFVFQDFLSLIRDFIMPIPNRLQAKKFMFFVFLSKFSIFHAISVLLFFIKFKNNDLHYKYNFQLLNYFINKNKK